MDLYRLATSDTDEVIGPILLQRQCDGGKADMSPQEWAKIVAERLKGNPAFHGGCGTRFKWWWGSGAYCPNCGILYVTNLGELKRYRLDVERSKDERQEVSSESGGDKA